MYQKMSFAFIVFWIGGIIGVSIFGYFQLLYVMVPLFLGFWVWGIIEVFRRKRVQEQKRLTESIVSSSNSDMPSGAIFSDSNEMRKSDTESSVFSGSHEMRKTDVADSIFSSQNENKESKRPIEVEPKIEKESFFSRLNKPDDRFKR